MHPKKWIVLIIGDHFMTNEIFHKAIGERLHQIDGQVSFKFLQNDWPDTPFMEVEEVCEALGDVDEIVRAVQDVDIVVTAVAPICRRVLDAAPSLKLIAVSRGGPLNINAAAAHERNISIVNVPGRNAPAVAEFTLGLILAHVKRIAETHHDMINGIWRTDPYRYENAPLELHGQVAGLVGFGIIGRLVAPLLKVIGMEVIAFDPYVDSHIFKENGVRQVTLQSLLEVSDIVSLHARVTKETVGIIGEQQLRKMKRNAILINTARGPLLDYKAFYRALKEGWIAGAALDTFDVEPIDFNNPLLTLKNVTFTPHIAGSSKETVMHAAARLAEDIVRFSKGEPLLGLI